MSIPLDGIFARSPGPSPPGEGETGVVEGPSLLWEPNPPVGSGYCALYQPGQFRAALTSLSFLDRHSPLPPQAGTRRKDSQVKHRGPYLVRYSSTILSKQGRHRPSGAHFGSEETAAPHPRQAGAALGDRVTDSSGAGAAPALRPGGTASRWASEGAGEPGSRSGRGRSPPARGKPPEGSGPPSRG